MKNLFSLINARKNRKLAEEARAEALRDYLLQRMVRHEAALRKGVLTQTVVSCVMMVTTIVVALT